MMRVRLSLRPGQPGTKGPVEAVRQKPDMCALSVRRADEAADQDGRADRRQGQLAAGEEARGRWSPGHGACRLARDGVAAEGEGRGWQVGSGEAGVEIGPRACGESGAGETDR